VVIADIDEEAGQAIAELASESTGVSLWLTSRDESGDLFRRKTFLPTIARALEKCEGWVSRDRITVPLASANSAVSEAACSNLLQGR
jgi:hypothetical protein